MMLLKVFLLIVYLFLFFFTEDLLDGKALTLSVCTSNCDEVIPELVVIKVGVALFSFSYTGTSL